MTRLRLPQRLFSAPTTRALQLASIGILLVALSACGGAGGASGGGGSGGGGSTPVTTPTPTLAPFSVTSVDLRVTPNSIGGSVCGSSSTFTYVATFHMPSNSAGGVIQFAYTLNNGRSQTAESLTVAPGATSATYTFTSTGVLPPDHTYPGIAIVMVTSPNNVMSPQVAPSGACATPAAFEVTSATMAVSPAIIAGMTCGSALTVTYTATFNLAPGGPGGTIQFEYTTTNGRGSQPASVTVAPGQTSATYTFTSSGVLATDHTYPQPGGVMVTSPNSLISSLVAPSGACS